MEELTVMIFLMKRIAVSYSISTPIFNKSFHVLTGTDEGLNLKTYPSSQEIKESEYDAFSSNWNIGGEYVVPHVVA